MNPLLRLITRLLRHTAQSLIFSKLLLSDLLLPIIIVTIRAANATNRSPKKPAEKLINIYVFHTYLLREAFKKKRGGSQYLVFF